MGFFDKKIYKKIADKLKNGIWIASITGLMIVYPIVLSMLDDEFLEPAEDVN